MQISERYGLVYVITKLGLLFVYDLRTATAVYRNRISPDPIFLTASSPSTGGFYAINRRALNPQKPHPRIPHLAASMPSTGARPARASPAGSMPPAHPPLAATCRLEPLQGSAEHACNALCAGSTHVLLGAALSR